MILFLFLSFTYGLRLYVSMEVLSYESYGLVDKNTLVKLDEILVSNPISVTYREIKVLYSVPVHEKNYILGVTIRMYILPCSIFPTRSVAILSLFPHQMFSSLI